MICYTILQFVVVVASMSSTTTAFTPNNGGSTTPLSSKSSNTKTSSIAATAPRVEVTSADHPLFQLANEYIYEKSGFYSSYDASVFAEDFVFRGPYIGPLNKRDYLQTMDTFGIYKAIPDINPNVWGYSLDPVDPEHRIWFMVRNTGTFTGEPGLGFGDGQYFPPNGAELQGSPETFSITFDDTKTKIKHLTVGYVADRFEGNTGGKGAAVGIFHVIGLPFPSPGPLLRFVQWFGTEVVNNGASSYSTTDIPAWWTEKSTEKASEGY